MHFPQLQVEMNISLDLQFVVVESGSHVVFWYFDMLQITLKHSQNRNENSKRQNLS